jgi:type IV pilus assembly protein PilC
MDYSYIAYTKDRKLVKGKIAAGNEQEANNLLGYGGYQVVNLKAYQPFLDIKKLNFSFTKVSTREMLMFSRQLALLIQSGVDVVNALELLGKQMNNRLFKKVIADVVADVREGKSLSVALGNHPEVFPRVYFRAIAAGEQAGTLDEILRQMAEFLERSEEAKKKLKSALSYPIFVLLVAVVVVIILTVFVLPTFIDMFNSIGSQLPFVTRLLVMLSEFMTHYGLYAILALVVAAVIGYFYTRTERGKYQLDKLVLRLPVIGNIMQLNELSYCCRIMSMLFRVGLPPAEIMNMAVQGTNNKIMAESLAGVQEEMLRGEGLSRPMSRRKIFLPLMVQMASVGEETGNLPNSMDTVARTYEMDADERTKAAIGLIQPVMTLVIGAVVVFIAVAMVSAIFGIYQEYK